MAVNSLEKNAALRQGYNHQAWEKRRKVLRFLLKHIGFNLLAKLDQVEGIENFPMEGPAILMMNHIAFIDSIVVLHTSPRNIVPLAKIEVYDYPVIGIVPRLWGVVPVRREEVDRRAVQQVLEVLRAGEVVLVAPEGTRGTQLQEGKEGVAYIASRVGAPIIPVAVEGTVGFPALRFSSRWRGPGARIRFGPAFRYRAEYHNARHELLHEMTDEAMYVLAGMLSPERRGVYADLSAATQKTIEFI